MKKKFDGFNLQQQQQRQKSFHTCAISIMENGCKAFDEIPKILYTIETNTLDLVDFVVLPLKYMYNISLNRSVFDNHRRSPIRVDHLVPI